MDYLIFIVSFLGLGLAGDFLVRGAAGIGGNFNLSKAFVGLTIVSAGTSAPELVISLQSVLSGASDISLGNVIGSNIINIGLILGITVLIYPISIKRNIIKLEWPFMFLSTVVFFLLVRDGVLDRLEAGFLFLSFIFFMAYLIRITKMEIDHERDESTPVKPLVYNLAFFAVGVVGLAFCGSWMVDSASNIARSMGISDRVIGLTLFALGTSLPELVTSVMAAWRKENDIVVGNILGSNIFNILLVLGTVGLIKPVEASHSIIHFDSWWMIGVSFLLFPFMYTGLRIARWEGLVLVGVVVTYFVMVAL